MSKRAINIILCVFSLLIGGMLYVLFRENTYISMAVNDIFRTEWIRLAVIPFSNNFLKYYFPDFLWSFSLCSGLFAVFEVESRYLCYVGAGSFLCGLIWEVLQYIDVISGTGDTVDIALYLSASLLAVLINIKISRSKK